MIAYLKWALEVASSSSYFKYSQVLNAKIPQDKKEWGDKMCEKKWEMRHKTKKHGQTRRKKKKWGDETLDKKKWGD